MNKEYGQMDRSGRTETASIDASKIIFNLEDRWKRFFFSPAPDTEVHGNPKVVQALCLARADGRVRSQSSRGGNNAMDLARQHGHTEVMKILGGSSYHVGVSINGGTPK